MKNYKIISKGLITNKEYISDNQFDLKTAKEICNLANILHDGYAKHTPININRYVTIYKIVLFLKFDNFLDKIVQNVDKIIKKVVKYERQ